MLPVVFSTTSGAELERFTIESLCSREKLDASQVKLHKSLIRRSGVPVGIVWRIEGPRLVRCHAIWVEDENRILFYDSAGNRFYTVKLVESPEISLIPM